MKFLKWLLLAGVPIAIVYYGCIHFELDPLHSNAKITYFVWMVFSLVFLNDKGEN